MHPALRWPKAGPLAAQSSSSRVVVHAKPAVVGWRMIKQCRQLVLAEIKAVPNLKANDPYSSLPKRMAQFIKRRGEMTWS
jgi:hypothetical protein